MPTALRILARLVPFRVFGLLWLVVTGTGLALHELPRYGGLRWGLTEQSHIATGWALLVLFAVYLGHHLPKKWGSFRRPQRLLGLALVTALGVALGTGVMLDAGMRGGPPPWTRPVHHASTWVTVVLTLWHGWPGVRKWWQKRGASGNPPPSLDPPSPVDPSPSEDLPSSSGPVPAP